MEFISTKMGQDFSIPIKSTTYYIADVIGALAYHNNKKKGKSD